MAWRVHRQSYSRSKLPNRLKYGLTDLTHSPSAHPPVKGFTYVGASQPELDIVCFIDHRVLATCKPWIYCWRRGGEHTLIIVRRTLTEPKTALAGVMLETSFARFMASMATFNAERIPSLGFCPWEFASIVESRR